MLEKLKSAEEKYIDIENELAKPDIFSNQEEYTRLMKEYKSLTPVIEKFREYKKVQSDLEEAREMLDEQLDAEMREMVNEEFKSCQKNLETLFEELKILLLPRDVR